MFMTYQSHYKFVYIDPAAGTTAGEHHSSSRHVALAAAGLLRLETPYIVSKPHKAADNGAAAMQVRLGLFRCLPPLLPSPLGEPTS